MKKTRYDIPQTSFIPQYIGVTFKIGTNDVYSSEFDCEIKNRIERCYEKNDTSGIYINKCVPETKLRFNLNDFKLKPNTTAYQFFQINCEKDTDIVIVPRASNRQKVWVNYNYYSHLGLFDIVYTIHLKKGINTIVFELPNATSQDTLFMRMSTLEYEKNCEYSFFDDRMVYSGDFGYIYRESNFLFDDYKLFSFIYFPNNDTIVPPNGKGTVKIYKITLENTKETKEIVLEDSISPLKKYTYDLSKFNYDANSFTYFHFELLFPFTNGKIHDDCVDIFTYYPQKSIEKIYKQADEYMNSCQATDYDKICIKHYIDRLNKQNQESTKASLTLQFYKRFQKVLSGKHFDDEICAPGFKEVLFYSNNFEEISNFFAFVPKNYDANKKYPLIILTTKGELVQSEHFVNYTAEDVIAVDVSLRGVTLGSYVGDAALWETVSEIKKCFSVDEDRIYITGNSNGGGAAFVQGELYPDRFAGIYPFSAGGVNKNMAMNLLNTKVITVSSPTESRYSNYQFIDNALKEINHLDYTGILADNFSHITLTLLWINKRIFEKLLDGKRNKYPEHISFRTMRNRCRKAYWIEIHSIKFGELYAEVDAVLSKNNIFITLKNATGITVTLPPDLPRDYFNIKINNSQEFTFLCYKNETINFVYKNNSFEVIDTYKPITDLHKGNGLLDVYLDPLVIAVPDNIDKDGQIFKSAVKFSHPLTNGYDPKVYVSYPIKTFTEIFETDYLYNKSFICFDDFNNAFLDAVRKNAAVQCDKDGYEYMNEKYTGKYCIMQIVRSPWNNKRNIVVISTNDSAFLSKNFFTRNVIIPTYATDYHPYWNNDVLIFNGKEYNSIWEIGMKVKILNNL